MPRKRVVSVTLRKDQIEWAKENYVNLSELLRALLDKHIQKHKT